MATTPPPSNAPRADQRSRREPPYPHAATVQAARRLPPLPLGYVGIIAVLLVVAAIGVGLAIGTIARPSPTPRPTPVRTVAVATPTPVPTTDPQIFRQTLTGACATGQGLWVVTNGGGLLRYDGEHWTLIDGTLRTLNQASCDEGTLYAVGPVGAMLIIDDRLRQITSFDVTLADLIAVAAMPEGAMAVGTAGTVMFLSGGSWQEYARGLEEDLYGIVAFGPQSAWVVGSQGASYRLEAAGWRPVSDWRHRDATSGIGNRTTERLGGRRWRDVPRIRRHVEADRDQCHGEPPRDRAARQRLVDRRRCRDGPDSRYDRR